MSEKVESDIEEEFKSENNSEGINIEQHKNKNNKT